MAIQEENIVFLKSQVMDDVPEGGGAATGNAVTDGMMNNVFDDISDLDRTYGRLNLRKLFLAVRSVDTDLYGGAKTVVTQLPDDEALGYALFSTEDPFDTRTEAADRVEAYLYKSAMWHGALNENHISGMRAISVIQRLNTALPAKGKTLCLVQDEGLSTQKEQYVRVTDVSAVERLFTDSVKGDYWRLIVTMSLSDALRFDFNGHSVNYTDSYSYTGKTRLRDTTVADATRYYGSTRLAEDAEIGDLKVKAASMFTRLVPSAETETPLVSQIMAGAVSVPVNAGSHTVDVAQTAHTRAMPVTAENRRLNWIETLAPIPGAGSLSISYMAQGNWYTLTDDGAGILSGTDPSFGAGTISYTTGTAAVTLGALPDAGSQIMYAWGSGVHYAIRTSAAVPKAGIRHSLGEAVDPGTLVLSWLQGGIEKTATGATDGVISGNGCTGRIVHATGDLYAEWTTPPDADSALGVVYDHSAIQTQTLSGLTYTAGVVSFTLASTPVRPGSVVATWSGYQTQITGSYRRQVWEPVYSGAVVVYNRFVGWEDVPQHGVMRATLRVQDNGAGTMGEEGTINYSTGAVLLLVEPELPTNSYQGSTGAWLSGSYPASYTGGDIVVFYALDSATPAARDIEIDLPPLAMRFGGQLISDTLVPGSLRFTWNGQLYRDLGNGQVYRSASPWNDATATLAGTVDYDAREVSLSSYVSGSGAVTVQSCLTRYGLWVGTDASFRTQLAPIKPEALSLFVTAADGTQLVGEADEDGIISGTAMTGTVNYEFGTAAVQFGATVEGQWVPREVDPSTLRYNAVAYSYLPLDADILGIDPVRLPSDGRVPIYRPGDVVMVMHPDETAPQTITDGGTISCGRTRLAWARAIDDAGETISGDLYTLDRAAGTLTFPDVSGIDQPITVRHTVGDLRMVTDAQISGWLTLSRALTHDYPADESLVASCLLFGDRRARVSAVWDQTSWNSVWADSIGSNTAATATLNTIDFPITVTNEGADTDRWMFRCTNAASHAWELISERRGLVWSGSYPPYTSGIPVDVAPINPRTRTELSPGVYEGGVPYLTIPQRANGGGWSTGNVVRINTVGAIADFWIARSIQQSEEPEDDGADGCELYALGNINRP